MPPHRPAADRVRIVTAAPQWPNSPEPQQPTGSDTSRLAHLVRDKQAPTIVICAGPEPPGMLGGSPSVARTRRWLETDGNSSDSLAQDSPGFVRAASRPSRHHLGQAALSFLSLLRQVKGAGLSPPLELPALSTAHLVDLATCRIRRLLPSSTLALATTTTQHQDDQGSWAVHQFVGHGVVSHGGGSACDLASVGRQEGADLPLMHAGDSEFGRCIVTLAHAYS